MICVSIGRARHKHMMAEHKHLVEQGYELVELRLDFIRSNVDLPRILKNRPGPLIATCRRAVDGGMWRGTEEDRQLILRTAIISGLAAPISPTRRIAGSEPHLTSSSRSVASGAR